MENTYIKVKMANGETAEFTLQYYALYQISKIHPEIYNTYSEAVGRTDEIALLEILYTAYVCAAVLKNTAFVDFEEFIRILPESHAFLLPTVSDLLYGKKKQA